MNNQDITILLVDDEPDILEIVGYSIDWTYYDNLRNIVSVLYGKSYQYQTGATTESVG